MRNMQKKYFFFLFTIFITFNISYSQTLTVSRGSNDHAASFEDLDGADIVMIQILLSASADMVINSITVDPVANNGMRRGEILDDEIRIYEDINKNGVLDYGIDDFITSENYSEQSNQTPAAAVVVAIPGKAILSGTDQNWIIVHTFSGADDGDNIQTNITNVSVNTGSVTGTPITGSLRTFEASAASQNGSLFIGEGGTNPINRNISNSATNEVMLQFILSTSTLENATITQIDFNMSGSADESTDLTSAKLYIDGDANGTLNLEEDTQIGSSVTTFTDNGTLSFPSINEVISAGSFEHWILVYNLNGSANNDSTFILDINNNSNITASGITISGAPVNSNAATVSATGSLILSLGSNNPSGTSISSSESELPLIQLNVAANITEDITISAIRFNTSGTADESTDIDSVILVLDGNSNGNYDPLFDTQIGVTITTLVNDSLITFSGISKTITAGNNENWLLLYYLNGNGSSPETFKTYFDVSTQITATGVTSSNSISPIGLPVNGNIMTISDVGTLTLALASANPGTANFNGTATNLSMLAFTMSVNDVEDIDITSITISATTNNMVKNDITDNDIKIYEDIDENGLLNVAIDRFITSQNYGGTGQVLGNAVISISGETINANSYKQWLIVHTLSGTSVGDYIEVSILSSNVSGIGLTSTSSANIAGSSLFGGSKTHVTGIPGSLTLSTGAQNPAFRFISGGTQDETMLQFQLSADAIEDIDITQFTIITSGTGNESNDVDSVRLFQDGDNNGSFNILNDFQLGSTVTSLADNDTLTFSLFNDTIPSSSAKNYIIVYNYNLTNNAVGETFKVVIGNAYVTATGITSTAGITPTGGPANGETATITDTGTLTVSAGVNNPVATNVGNSDDNVVTIQLNIGAGSNEDVTITATSFTLSGTFNDATDFEAGTFVLYDDDNGNGAVDIGESQLGSGQSPSADNGTVTFSGLSQTVLAGTGVNWIVLCNLNGAASNFENFRVSFSNSAHITATGDDTGDDIFPAGAPVQGGLFTVGATGSLSLTLGANNPSTGTENPGAQGVEMLQLRLSASGVENITVTQAVFTADGSGDDLAVLNDAGNGVSLYIDVNSDGQLDGGDTQLDIERTYSANNGTVTFNFSTTITAGTSQRWLIVYDFDAAAVNGTTFRVGIYDATQITSTGVSSGNPITETGFPKVGNYKTITTIGTMSIFAGDFNPGVAYIDAANDYEMLQIKISVSSIEAIDVDDLTITHIGTGSPVNDIASNGVQLVRDNNNNGAYDSGIDDILAVTNFSGTTATFTLAPVTIPVDSVENWLVMYDFVFLTMGQTYRARVTSLTDLGLTGVISLQSITASGSVPIAGGTMTVNNDFGLPVELSSFEATGDYGKIILNWETQSELNNLGFDVQRKLSDTNEYDVIASYLDLDELRGQGSVSHATRYEFIDLTTIPEQEYSYRLVQYDYNGAVNVEKIIASATAKMPLPTEFELAQNYPNPFNPVTKIKWALPSQSEVTLIIYNILGQEIITLSDEVLDIGRYEKEWQGGNEKGTMVASGMYFYVLQAKNIITKKQHREIKKMMLIR